MADSKISALTADTSPTSDDLLVTVNDPAGTPANKKVTASDLITKAHGLGNSTVVGVAGGVLTSGTDVAVVDGGTGSSTAAGARTNLGLVIGSDVVAPNQDTTGKSAKTDALNSATTVVDVASATAPTTGQVLTATDSTHATWQAAGGGGGTPQLVFHTQYAHGSAGYQGWPTETAGMTHQFTASSQLVYTDANAGDGGGVYSHIANPVNWIARKVAYSLQYDYEFGTNPAHGYWGLGLVTTNGTSGLTFTTAHLGVKVIVSGGVVTHYATVGSGTTETAVSFTPTQASGDDHGRLFSFVFTPGVNCKFYDDGVLVATITTNLPSSITQGLHSFGVSNVGSATAGQAAMSGFACWSMDAF